MTDNEIIKALECCINYNDCDKCDFEPKDNKKKTIGCCLEIMKNAHTLINRLQAIVEKSEKVEYCADKTIATLQAENERLEVENQSLRGAANSLKMHYEEAQAEIERLEKTEIEVDDFCRRLCRMRMLNGRAIASYEDLQNYILTKKSEAVKEFAQKVIEKVEKARQKYQRLCAEQGDKEDEAMNIHFRGMINLVKEMEEVNENDRA